MLTVRIASRDGFADPIGESRIQLLHHRFLHSSVSEAHVRISELERAGGRFYHNAVICHLSYFASFFLAYGFKYPEQILGHRAGVISIYPFPCPFGNLQTVASAHLSYQLYSLIAKPVIQKIVIASQTRIEASYSASV